MKSYTSLEQYKLKYPLENENLLYSFAVEVNCFALNYVFL